MRPTPRTLWLVGAVAGLALLASFVPALLAAWWVAVLGLGLALVVDAARHRREPPLEVERAVASSLSIGVRAGVELTLENPTHRAQRTWVFDGVPAEADLEGQPRRLLLPAGAAAELRYGLRPLRRGDLRFGRVQLLVESPWRLWAWRRLVGEEATVRVYPDFAAVAGLTLLALENRVGSMGIRARQRRGAGLDFHQLRDYQLGDSLRQIDWKATSRKRRAISREYQEERDQRVVFLVDCGRRMRSQAGSLSHFDHCLNAVLLVSWIALRQGDAVGLVTFSGADRWIPPRKGRASLHGLLRGLYDLEATLEPPDYTEAASRLRKLQPRRSLVVLLTNQREEDEGDLTAGLTLLSGRHLVLLASLREEQVERRLTDPVDSFEQALSACRARAFADARARALERLRGKGRLTLDVRPGDLAVALAERYLDIKRAGTL